MINKASDNLSFYFMPTSISAEDFKQKDRVILPMQLLRHEYTYQKI